MPPLLSIPQHVPKSHEFLVVSIVATRYRLSSAGLLRLGRRVMLLLKFPRHRVRPYTSHMCARRHIHLYGAPSGTQGTMSNAVALRPCARGARALCPCRISVAIHRKPTQCSIRMPVFAKLSPAAAGRRATSASTSCCTKSNLEKLTSLHLLPSLTSLQLRRRARRVPGTFYAPRYSRRSWTRTIAQ